jgi:hypothetical protein
MAYKKRTEVTAGYTDQTVGELIQKQISAGTEPTKNRNLLTAFGSHDYNGKKLVDMTPAEFDDGTVLADFVLNSDFAADVQRRVEESWEGKIPKEIINERGETKKNREFLEAATPLLNIFNRLNTVMNAAGLNTGEGSPRQNIRTRIRAALNATLGVNAETADGLSGYNVFRGRKELLEAPPNAYQDIKQVLTSLKGREKGYLGLKLFSGFRQTDMSNIIVEEYNNTTGRIQFREGKSGDIKETTLRIAARPFLELLMEGRETGEILAPDKKALDNKVNTALKKGVTGSLWRSAAGMRSRKPFTLSNLRNYNEDVLDGILNDSESAYAAGRAGTTEAAKYRKASSQAKRIRRKLNQADAAVVGYSAEESLGQYLLNIGIPEKYIPEEAVRIVPTVEILEDEEFLSALSADYLAKISQEGPVEIPEGQPTAPLSPAVASKSQSVSLLELEKREIELQNEVLNGRAALARRIEENPELSQPLNVLQSGKAKTTEPQVEIVEQPAPDYSDLSPSLQEALKALGNATRRTRQVGKPVEEQETQTPSISQAADIFGTALDILGSGQELPRVGEVQPEELGQAPMPKSFRDFARKAGRIYRAGRTLYGGYMLKKAVQENLQPSQPGEPMTMYDIGSDLVSGIQKTLQRTPDISTPTQPSTSPEYDEFSDIQRDLSKSKYNGESP